MSLSKQAYYDLLVTSAKDGTFPSNKGGVCKYRRDDTADCKIRCAAGILIKDEDYDCIFEGVSVVGNHQHREVHREKLLEAIQPVDGLNIGNISDVQKIHDGMTSPVAWNSNVFISKINALRCFSDVVKQESINVE